MLLVFYYHAALRIYHRCVCGMIANRGKLLLMRMLVRPGGESDNRASGEKMRPFLLKCAGLLAGLTIFGAAPAAADGPYRAYTGGPYMHEGIANWSGIYVGGAIGYSFSSSNLSHDYSGVITGNDRFGIDQDGANATLTVGFDLQTAGPFVWGFFGDYTFGAIRESVVLATAPTETLRFRLQDSWAAGGRLGLVHNGALWYMTAGYTGIDVSFADLGKTLHGYFLGAGLEKDIGKNFRLKVEYRFADYGKETLFDGSDGCCDARLRVDSSVHSVRLGMSYVFGQRETYYHEPLK